MILGLIAFTVIIAIAAKYVISKSDGLAPTFYVVVANTEIKIGDLITESAIVPMVIPGSLVKSQAFYWSTDGLDASGIAELNSMQTKKIIGKKANKLFSRGDQITVIGIE